MSRHKLGRSEYEKGNHEFGIRHWTIAAGAGLQMSLDSLKEIFFADGKLPGKEFIGKETLDNAFRVCHAAQVEVNSEERAKHSDVEYDDFRC